MVHNPNFRTLAHGSELRGARAKSGGDVGARRATPTRSRRSPSNPAEFPGARALGAAIVGEQRRSQCRRSAGCRRRWRSMRNSFKALASQPAALQRGCAACTRYSRSSPITMSALQVDAAERRRRSAQFAGNAAAFQQAAANAAANSVDGQARQVVRGARRRCEGDERAPGMTRPSSSRSPPTRAASRRLSSNAQASTPRSTPRRSTRWRRTAAAFQSTRAQREPASGGGYPGRKR